MRVLARNLFLLLSVFPVLALPAFALPGEATAVVAHCGSPDADTRSISEVDGLPQRTLTYGKMRLNFQTAAGSTESWSFTTGWNNHIPMTANEVGNRMPCFREALADADAQASTALSADPSIAAQEQTLNRPHALFGIANLWIILLLIGVVAIFALAIPRRRRVLKGPDPAQRPFRKPMLRRFRRRPARTILPEQL